MEGRRLKQQWLQDPTERNENSLINVRLKASEHFRKERGIFERQN
jgi:hypothetical protein